MHCHVSSRVPRAAKSKKKSSTRSPDLISSTCCRFSLHSITWPGLPSTCRSSDLSIHSHGLFPHCRDAICRSRVIASLSRPSASSSPSDTTLLTFTHNGSHSGSLPLGRPERLWWCLLHGCMFWPTRIVNREIG